MIKNLLVILIFLQINLSRANESDIFKLMTPDYFKSSKIIDLKESNHIKKLFGRAHEIEKENWFYIINGLKYPLSFKLNKNKIERVYARLLDKRVTYDQLEDFIQKNNGKKIPSSDSPDLFYVIELPSLKLKLTFKYTQHQLYSVEKWY